MTQKKPNKNTMLDRSKYIPFYLVNLANNLSRSASRVYLSLFDVGIIEWRMLSILAIDSHVTAAHICQSIHVDGAAASRSLKILENKNLVTLVKDSKDGRKRLIVLTQAGKDLHEKIITIAIERQKILSGDIAEEDITHLLKTLDALNDNFEKVQKFDIELIKNKTL